MGKKKKTENLGRALIKDRFSSRGKRNDSMLHTSELNDGYDWGRLNLQSVTEESSFDEFLRTAELAGTEFQAEKLNMKFVSAHSDPGVLTLAEREKFEITKQQTMDLLRIPRRPLWDRNMTGEELQEKERESFLEWRRTLAELQENQGLILTPYEKNLEFWRQLWRVVERSDVVVQILDARDPLMFRCEDLEKYVKEVSKEKLNLLLLNKSDYLTSDQRRIWARYFDSLGLVCAFYSAVSSDNQQIEELNEDENETKEECKSLDKLPDKETTDTTQADYNDSKDSYSTNEPTEEDKGCKEETDDCEGNEGQTDEGHKSECSTEENSSGFEEIIKKETNEEKISDDSLLSQANEDALEEGVNSCRLISGDELIRLFEKIGGEVSTKVTADQVTVGLVGYPNVGKSSTINSLMGVKRVSVSATPGKTKHFQTLIVEGSSVMLCDCPGLVFPSVVATKADMLLSGILPIDQMRDYTEAVASLRSIIPDHILQSIYSIIIPDQPPGVHPHSPYSLLSSYAYSRGFMTANGCPDMSRAARLVLKDFVKGKLLFCRSPPGQDQLLYHPYPPAKSFKPPPSLTPAASRAIADRKTVSVKELDKGFFNKVSIGAHSKGSSMAGVAMNQSQQNLKPGSSENQGKAWKDHSHKRNKREKLRRVYRHLDE